MRHRPIECFDSHHDACNYLEEQGFSWVDERKLYWVGEATKVFLYLNADQTVTAEYV